MTSGTVPMRILRNRRRDVEMFNAGLEAAAQLMERSEAHGSCAGIIRIYKQHEQVPVTPYRVIGVVCDLTGTADRDLLSPRPDAELQRFRGVILRVLIDRGAGLFRWSDMADLFGQRIEVLKRLMETTPGPAKSRLHRSVLDRLGIHAS